MPQLRSPRIWGTLSASGGSGATTFALHLAQVATGKGLRVLLVETDIRSPLREILGAVPPYWQEYRVDHVIPQEAMARECSAGFALLSRRSTESISEELFKHVIDSAHEYFDLILIDSPISPIPMMNTLVVAENSLPALIGLHTLTPIYKPQIVIINKFSPRIKKRAALAGFITDAKIFTAPKNPELQLAIGFGITRKLSKDIERLCSAILNEMLR